MASLSLAMNVRLIAGARSTLVQSSYTSPLSSSVCLASTRRVSSSSPRTNSTTGPHPSANAETQALTGSDKLVAEAVRLEAQEEATLAKKARRQDPNDPIWTGEERVQDTVLRMVMDKYKPLRIGLADQGKDPADEKIKAGIQTPTSPGLPTRDSGSGLFVRPGTQGAHEGGRKLPKTPDEKPWRAVYVRPAHLLGAGTGEDEFTPSIYYGQFLNESKLVATAGSQARNKLKAAGVNVAALPIDDAKAMKQLREAIQTAERQAKLVRARDSVLDYQLSQHSPSSTQESEVKGDSISDTNRNLQLQLGHAQGWDSVIEKRIKAALDSGAFKENKLRGKPIQRDIEEKNPFLAREEYFMNRIVKRQGAAPPWVELNAELESEVNSWKQRLDDGWVRRASRMITTSGTLSEGLEAFALNATIENTREQKEKSVDAKKLMMPEAKTTGEKRLVEVATRYRDAEWQDRERAYHTLELNRLNDLIRKHNHLAPFTARKGLMLLDIELANMYARALPKLVYEISSILHAKSIAHADGKSVDGWDDLLHKQPRDERVRYDMWGREVRKSQDSGAAKGEKAWLNGWLGGGMSSGSADAEAERAKGGAQGAQGASATDANIQNLGLWAAFQKSLHWAKQRIVGA